MRVYPNGARSMPQKGRRRLEQALHLFLPSKNQVLPSLEDLLFDSSIFEELPLEVLIEEVFSLLGAVYGGEVVKGVHELLKDSTPFKMSTKVSYLWFMFFMSVFVAFVHRLHRPSR